LADGFTFVQEIPLSVEKDVVAGDQLKATRARIEKALIKVDEKTKNNCYQAWLGKHRTQNKSSN
jgi:hypothetical protein